jgi:transposase
LGATETRTWRAACPTTRWGCTMGPHPIELRQRVVDAYRRGMGSFTDVGEQFAVSHAFVCDMVARYQRTGSVAPDHHGGGRHKLGLKGDAKLRALVEADPDATLDELRARLRRSRRMELTRSGICRALQRLGLPRKKKRSMRPSKAGPMYRQRAERFVGVRGAATRGGTSSSMNLASTSR